MPPQHWFSVILGTRYPKLVSLLISRSWMTPAGLLTEWGNLQMLAHLCCFRHFAKETFLCDDRAERSKAAEDSLWVSHFWATVRSIARTYQPRKCTAVPLQKPMTLTYSLLTTSVGLTLLTHLSATSLRMLKLLGFKYFQLLKKGTLEQIYGFTASIIIIIFKRCNIYIKITQVVIKSKDKWVFVIRSVIYNYFLRHKQCTSVLH